MNIIKKLFSPKGVDKSDNQVQNVVEGTDIVRNSARYFEELLHPYVATHNYLELFKSVPEVFWPIDYIATRIAGARFELKRVKDDSLVWYNKSINKLLSNPNCLMGWQEMVYQHFVYKLCTGNAYLRANLPSTYTNERRWRWCDNYWTLPADYVRPIPMRNVPLFGIAELEDILEHYRLEMSNALNGWENIPVCQIWHDRDGAVEYTSGPMFLKSHSRLSSLNKPISNLIAVYEARNIIYVKRGAIGFIVSQKQDQTGSVALTAKEKQELRKEINEKYGLGEQQSPYGVTDVPISFVRTNLSITELQPFDETLADAITIASAYGIPAVLVPRKDQSTFSNQATAEKSVYCGMVIPMAKKFCADLTSFLGLDQDGLYLDCNFNDVDCLQQGLKEAEEVKKLVNERCSAQFDKGLITLNDWRAQIGESQVEDELFGKLKFQMTDEEIETINRVFNTKISDDNGRENQTPNAQDQGE